MSYECVWDGEPHGATFLFTHLTSGQTLQWCDEHMPAGLIPLVGAELGVDPMKFFEAVRKFVDREAKAAAKPATVTCPACETVINGTAADIDSGLRKHTDHCAAYQAAASAAEQDTYDPGPEIDDQGGASEHVPQHPDHQADVP